MTPTRKRFASIALPTILVGILVLWQLSFFTYRRTLPTDYHTQEIVGLHDPVFQNFLYFFYYFGVFPVGSRILDRTYTQEGADRFLKQNGETLVMDLGTGAGKMGDYGKLFLYLPEVVMHGSPENASVKTGCFLLYIVGLVSLFLAFWIQGQALIGSLLVILIGSDPFQIFQVYRNNNVFSVAISVALIVWALNISFFFPKLQLRRWHYLAVILTGVILALAKGIRVEAGFMVLGALGIYATASCTRRQRLLLLATLLISQKLTTFCYESAMDRLYYQSIDFVEKNGGTPYKGPRRHHHVVWHTLATGLGDFGQKYGYAWEDRKSFAYGMPKVIERYHPEYVWKPGEFYLENSHDGKGVYPIQPEDLPEFEIVMRERILGDIFSDPIWYLGVLAQRSWRILTDLTPASLAFGQWRIGIPLHGILVLILLGWLTAKKAWPLLKITLFTLPLCLGPLLHYSGGGLTYFALYHLAALAVALSLLWHSKILPHIPPLRRAR